MNSNYELGIKNNFENYLDDIDDIDDDIDYESLKHNAIITNYCYKNEIDKKSFEEKSTKKYYVWNTESIHTKIYMLCMMLNTVTI